MGNSNSTIVNHNARNILLLGRTGNGKSTLANVLVNKNGNFEEVFKESAGSVSQTKDAQVEEFEYEGIDYRIIDTIGIGDTKLTEKEYFNKLSKITGEIKNGINQILFVVKGRFTEEETKAYSRLVLAVFDDDVTKYTSIVRVSFPDFTDKEKCREDLANSINESKEIKYIIEDINFIHVDNPPVDISGDDRRVKLQIEANKLAREDSRKIILDFLKTQRGTYKPLSNISESLKELEYMSPYIKDQLQKKDNLIKKLRGELEKSEKKVRELEDQIKNLESKNHHQAQIEQLPELTKNLLKSHYS